MNHFYHNIGEDWFTYPKLYSSVIEKYGEGAHFVEVGSWKGRSAAYMAVEIINSGYNIEFDCIDTWEGSIEHLELDAIKNKSLYSEFLKNTAPVKKYINPIRITSLEGSTLYQDNSLDFVFIDAFHQYEDVLEDIKVWLPKVKVGGILAGHDYGHQGVNKAVNEFFSGKKYDIEEDCWIYTKQKEEEINCSDITLVTGLWDIKRDTLTEGWNRSYDHYLTKFSELLKTPYNLIIYGDKDLESFVWQHRSPANTQFIERGVEFFHNSEFYPLIQGIRKNEDWYSSAGWIKESTQASLEVYNPLVMSKMFLLNDARLISKFNTEYMFWIDAGITNTTHYGYYTSNILNNLTNYVNGFMFIAFPYEAINEIHGFDYKEMCRLTNSKVKKIARGGFFGGKTDSFDDVNSLYYHMLKSTLERGFMGTEESIFTILMYKYCEKFTHFEIDYDGLVYNFFENLGNNTLEPKSCCKNKNSNITLNTNNVGLYVISFNSPNQFGTLIKSMIAYDEDFIKKPKKILLDNSTNPECFDLYAELCKKYEFEHIKKDNIGICGGRQFIAENAEEKNLDFYFFFEDDMFFYSGIDTVCRNGFNRKIPNLYKKSLDIVKNEGFDFLKLCYTEVFGDNGTQWAWYNVPQPVREKYWPEYSKLPEHGTDPNAPRTLFKSIKSYNQLSFVSGEIYYSNWPQVVSKYGNRKMFIDTKFAHPFEQTWMSFMYQEVKEDNLYSGLLLASPTEHDRFDHYDGKIRREN